MAMSLPSAAITAPGRRRRSMLPCLRGTAFRPATRRAPNFSLTMPTCFASRNIRTNRGESSFRILVTADDHTEVLVRKGEVEITTPQGGTRVGEGQFITVQGAGDQAQYKIGEAPAREYWDQGNTDRDNVIRHAASRRHTNDYYVGAEDLDNHGTWSEVPDYGQVWRPTETDPDWAPYRNGHWV